MSSNDEHTLKVQQLFVRHQGQLKAFVKAFCPNSARADDVLQEVFLTVTTKAEEFDLESNFLAWARTIARFKVLEAGRAGRQCSLSPEIVESLAACCPEDWADDHRLDAMTSCLDELAPKAREIVQLRYQREHSPTEIAQLLDRTVNSVNVALSKARVALRLCIDKRLAGEGGGYE
jgi:RNA polymerase sigma-70 factor, ECF subfamily